MRREEFNGAARAEAIAALRTCADVTRWCEQLVDRRPYASIGELLAEAASAADPFTPDEARRILRTFPLQVAAPPRSENSRGGKGATRTD